MLKIHSPNVKYEGPNGALPDIVSRATHLHITYSAGTPPLEMDRVNPGGGLAARLLYAHFCRISYPTEDFFMELQDTFETMPSIATALRCIAEDLVIEKAPAASLLVVGMDDLDNLALAHPESAKAALAEVLLLMNKPLAGLGGPQLVFFPFLACASYDRFREIVSSLGAIGVVSKLTLLRIDDSKEIAKTVLGVSMIEDLKENVVSALAILGGHPLSVKVFLESMAREQRTQRKFLETALTQKRAKLLEMIEARRLTGKKRKQPPELFLWLEAVKDRTMLNMRSIAQAPSSPRPPRKVPLPVTLAELRLTEASEVEPNLSSLRETIERLYNELNLKDRQFHEVYQNYRTLEMMERPAVLQLSPGSFANSLNRVRRVLLDSYDNLLSLDLLKCAVHSTVVAKYQPRGKPTSYREAEVAGFLSLVKSPTGGYLVHLPMIFALTFANSKTDDLLKGYKLVFEEPHWRDGNRDLTSVEKVVADFETLRINLYPSGSKITLKELFSKAESHFSQEIAETEV